ncbi:hypothetical protein [uncultured Rheinheimera sp.]|uniref:hypothetical protein n=1 Tax=uncultured Rheinheimera sp. TaxID=400532 RepID=UPI00259452C2|nr:hypothetical protein [uncultured Rheinheimera sp.]
MLALLSCTLSVACTICCILIYKHIASSPTVRQIESTVAKEMKGRAHCLCLQAYDAERIVNPFERKKATEKFQDDLHLYLEDYQAEVALRIKEYKVRSISAYGYIRLMK